MPPRRLISFDWAMKKLGPKKVTSYIVNYDFGIIYIRFVGSHKEYDKIDATSIWGEKMIIKPIKTEVDYTDALQAVEELMSAKEFRGRTKITLLISTS